MKNIFILLSLFISIISLSQNVKDNKMQKKSRIEILKDNGFKFPDDKLFKTRINDVYGVNLDTVSEKELYLEVRPIIPDVPDLYPTVFIKYKYLDADNFENDLIFVSYNKYIFYKDKASLLYLKYKDKNFLYGLIQNYGYYDDYLIKYIFDEINNDITTTFAYFIFFGRKGISGRWELRRDVFQQYLEYNPDIEVSATQFISPLINKEIPYEGEREKDVAFILERLIIRNENKDIGIVGEVDYIFKSYPRFLKYLVDNDFFEYHKLKNYYEVMYFGE